MTSLPVRPAPMPPTLTTGGLLARRAKRSPSAPAVVSGDRRVTFAELEDRVSRAAAVLRDCDVGKGDRVALLLRNGLEYCELFYAIGRIGAICCALNYRLTGSELGHIVGDCGATILIHEEEFADVARSLSADTGSLRTLPVAGVEQHLATTPPLDAPDATAPGDPLLLVYTSGTTGRPKGAVITHQQLVWASLTIGHTVDFRSGDVHLLPAPMFHVGGLSFTVHCVHVGATLVIPPGWNAGQAVDLIAAEGVNHFFAVPTMIADLLAADSLTKDRLRSVRWIMSGAAPLPADLVERCMALGIPVIQSYGATETCGPAACMDVDSVARRPGSIGLPFFHTEIRLQRDDGVPPTAGEQGEIQVRAPHIFAGYWGNAEATREAFEDGWFRTGDIGYRDDDGYLFLVDRKSELIISGGENIYPLEVEQVLESHPAIAEAAVVGLPDPKWGQIVCAVISCGARTPPSLEEVAAHCLDRLARYKIPRKLVVRDRLIRNATGKVQRGALRRELSDD
ncbi:long-chain fatty acid--CoA ligase [Microbaculum marinum]|uniref:Long-chain fatty acid--CoA ligase n=1 Tax=Microbaculum marinum TaxID=1764581 RepID=A0AAW9RX18_9HYPH